MNDLERLLVLQEHDTALDQLRHRRDTLPERAALAQVEQDGAAIDAYLADVGGRRDVVARRQKALEDEIASTEAKVVEVDKRLYSGTVSAPRELQALQADIDSLKRHQSAVEDQVLEVMEEREPLDEEVTKFEASRAGLDSEAQRLLAALAETEAVIDAEIGTEQAARDESAAPVPESLLTLYEQLRGKLGGIAVARLEPGGRCGGCHLTLPAQEVARIKRESPDVLEQCDNCGRILVRSSDPAPAGS